MAAKIVNLVATVRFPQEVDVIPLRHRFPSGYVVVNVNHRKRMIDVAAGSRIRIKMFTTSANIFGASGMEELESVVNVIASVTGFSPKDLNVKIVNEVVSAEIGRRINLQILSKLMPNSTLTPWIFPGLIAKINNTSVLIFSSGKIVVLGPSASSKLDEVVKYIKELLETYEGRATDTKQ